MRSTGARKRVVMSLAVVVDDGEGRPRAADVASRAIRRWTGGDRRQNEGITLLSARWECDDDPAAVTER
jgi:hypothetical protein